MLAEGALSPIDPREEAALSADEIARGVRLACVTRLEGEASVQAPHPRVLARSEISSEGFAPGDGLLAPGAKIAIALDVGTTTLTAALVDATTGDVVELAKARNPQSAWGADVLSRISAAQAGASEPMRQAVADALGELVGGLVQDIPVSQRSHMQVAVAGNTTMLHLLAGADMSGLGVAPYTPNFLGEQLVAAGSLGLGEFAQSVSLLPGVSAFVGADAVAGILSTHLLDHAGTVMLVDIGTNGEVVLKTSAGNLFATSAAAGPAFEGAGIRFGMAAESGAIEHAWLEDGELGTRVVGDGTPRGICGSGLVDLVAALLDGGTLDRSGSLHADVGALGQRVVERDGILALSVVDDVILTQHDVRQVQLAKGAIRAAAEMLVDRAGIATREVDAVLVGGGFGSSLSGASLTRIGLLPCEWGPRTAFVGEVSLRGAARWLTDDQARVAAAELVDDVTVVDLAAEQGFQELFVSRLDFPEGHDGAL